MKQIKFINDQIVLKTRAHPLPFDIILRAATIQCTIQKECQTLVIAMRETYLMHSAFKAVKNVLV